MEEQNEWEAVDTDIKYTEPSIHITFNLRIL